ncbi:hypothetical protein [Methylobacterium sp. J-068]|uniref:hypothetical protein n=1 Tax=Methylobacterium sp. J-068 TaxID=2836649 RepID=UPI001FB90393|nr:hypothetical protein [Methylobacterium sp. J-068]MCJ2035958.1 hypothetical protein [Methylobacterium sp. J-068]
MFTCTGHAAASAGAPLTAFTIERRASGANDVEIVSCGVRPSDLHQARDAGQNTLSPGVPGHGNADLGLLERDGTQVQVGAPEKPLDVNVFRVIRRRRDFAGSLIGGNGMIPIDRIETADGRMLENDVTYRVAIDTATLPKAARRDPALES